jgi:hypothetical protein
MPDPQRLLNTLRRAVAAFRSVPGRLGRLVNLAQSGDVEELLVAGDLHGNLDNLRKLILTADLGRRPRRHLVLQELIHSDIRYPDDGGDCSHRALDLLAALVCQYPRQVHFLLGNHELSQRNYRRIGKNDQDLNRLFIEGVLHAYGDRADEILAAYWELFDAALLAVRTPNRVFVSHSLPPARHLDAFDPAVLERDQCAKADLEPGGSVHALVWGRDTSAENTTAFLRKVDADLLITGHLPCDNGFEIANPRQLILDSLGRPAAYCLVPTNRPLTIDDLTAQVRFL